MLKNSLVLVLLFMMFGCVDKTAPSSNVQTEPSKPVVKFNYSLDELHAASNYLTALTLKRTDDKINRKKPRPLLKCDPTDATINMWSMQVKSLIDEQASDQTAKPYDENEKNYDSFCGSRLHLYLMSLSK